MPRRSPAAARVSSHAYQMRIYLKGTRPRIWRRFVASPETRLDELHEIVQIVMGWEDCHLHMFAAGKRRFQLPTPWDDVRGFGPPVSDEREYRIGQILTREKDWIDYVYDFGDHWDHRIVLQRILSEAPDEGVPSCLSGKCNCPPEDSGGLWGFYHKLEIVADPDHEEHDWIREWMGGYDPDDFSVDEVNAQLQFRRGLAVVE